MNWCTACWPSDGPKADSEPSDELVHSMLAVGWTEGGFGAFGQPGAQHAGRRMDGRRIRSVRMNWCTACWPSDGQKADSEPSDELVHSM
jgi:hypothetical protein